MEAANIFEEQDQLIPEPIEFFFFAEHELKQLVENYSTMMCSEIKNENSEAQKINISSRTTFPTTPSRTREGRMKREKS
jgi:hypothetical protein